MPYRDSHTPEARAAHARAKRRWRAKRGQVERPFVGVDGEGAGVDELGRQVYRLLRAGDAELWHGGAALTAEECLDFLSGLDPAPIYVGYYFDYDATVILNHLPPAKVDRLFARTTGRQHWVDWKDWQVDYLPRRYLRVRRRAPGARWVTVNDVGSFFQCRFTKAIMRWEVGTPAERAEVERGKLRRGGKGITDEDRRYNALEVKLLQDMMQRVREAAREIDYLPSRWQGPGALAKAMLRRHGIQKRLDRGLPKPLIALAEEAYYGGRFETPQIGAIPGPIHEYDLSNAYPHAFLSLPCLIHGRWVKETKKVSRFIPSSPWIGRAQFQHPGSSVLCHLPVRSRQGIISWPRTGSGTYWGVEIEAAMRAGTNIQVGTYWSYHQECTCRPFSWVPEVYAERIRWGPTGKGHVLKLGLNAIYGSLAQRVGAAPYRSIVWAGLVTATTRARLIDLYRGREAAVVMLATDGIYSRDPLPVPFEETDGLGSWKEQTYPEGIFVVQPGLWWAAKTVKTRGISLSLFAPHRERFRAAFAGRWREPPVVEVPVTLFVGLKLASARHAHGTAGMWKETIRNISFDWTGKRGEGIRRGPLVLTLPRSGGIGSVPYREALKHLAGAELDREELEAQPDHVDLLEDNT